MKRNALILSILWIVLAILIVRPALAQEPVIRAVLFYSPTCSHCHEVMDEILPPLVAQYPGQLDIVGIDVSHAVGSNLYQAALNEFDVPDDRIGVPTLIVGSTVLVGSEEIPQQFPQIIAAGLAAGGIDWPEIPGLQAVLAAQVSGGETAPSAPTSGGQPGFMQQFMKDPLANTIAVIVLIIMLVVLVVCSAGFLKGGPGHFMRFPAWTVPLLAIIGLGVALYLSYVEVSGNDAICGPVGNCNSVQQSPYAYLFGILPVGVMGTVGYIAILAAWLAQRFGSAVLKKWAAVGIWLMSWFGLLFSIYLTFLEPFVIGATCAWCISSALIMTLLLLAATDPARQALVLSDEHDEEDDVDDEEDLAETE